MTNNVIQTGPNIQLGGLNAGFLIAAYQVGIEDEVKIEPIMPASWHTTSEIMSFVQFIEGNNHAGYINLVMQETDITPIDIISLLFILGTYPSWTCLITAECCL